MSTDVIEASAERHACTNHPDATEPCQHPATHRIIAADGTIRALACRIAERYLNEGERSEPINPANARIKAVIERPSSRFSGEAASLIADLRRLRSLIPAEHADAHALLAQIVGRVAMIG